MVYEEFALVCPLSVLSTRSPQNVLVIDRDLELSSSRADIGEQPE